MFIVALSAVLLAQRINHYTTTIIWGLRHQQFPSYPSSLAVYYGCLSQQTGQAFSLPCDVRESGCFQVSTTGQILICRLGIQPLVLIIYILNDIRPRANACTRRFVARALGSSLCGKFHGILSGPLRQRSRHQSLYFADDSLYDRSSDLRGNHGFRVEKGDREAFGASNRTATVAPVPRWRQSTTSSGDSHGAYKNATGIAISNAQYMMIGNSSRPVLFIAMWLCLKLFGEWFIRREMKPLDRLKHLLPNQNAKPQQYSSSWESSYYGLLPELVGRILTRRQPS